MIRLYHDSDFAAVLATIHAATRADGDAQLISEADLRARLTAPHSDPRLDPRQDCFVAEVRGVGVVAYADGVLRGDRSFWSYRTDGYVSPGSRRQGIGRALMDRLWERTQELSAFLGGETITLEAWALETQEAALRLFEQCGMRRVRYFFQMHRDLSEPIPPLETLPDWQLLTWAERRDDRAVWLARNEAFADHWRWAPTPFDVFLQLLQHGRYQPEYSFVVWAGEQIAGGVLNDLGLGVETRHGLSWISQLFVRRPWRKRGLGRALLIASLLKARELGHASIGLNVDAENLTGAVRLYEAVGFRRASTRVAYERVYSQRR